jgi:hypothetical protein
MLGKKTEQETLRDRIPLELDNLTADNHRNLKPRSAIKPGKVIKIVVRKRPGCARHQRIQI